jgi:hypothetical protein
MKARTFVLVLAVMCVALPFAFAPDDDIEDVQPVRPGLRRLRNVWGRIKDVSEAKRLLAVEVETEEGDKIAIFQLTNDTKIRKAEHVKKFDDLDKGIEVIVFYRDKTGDEKYPTALMVRIRDEADPHPGKRRKSK